MLEDRITDVQSSCARTRSTVFIAAIIAAMIFVAVWNTYFTWSRHWLLPESANTASVSPTPQAQLRDLQLQQEVREFMDNKDINLGLLGIRVSSDDVPILGSLALCIVSLYHLLTCRRANRDVASLLIEAKNAAADDMRAVYFGIRSELVFNAASAREKPISTLDYKFKPADVEHQHVATSIQILLYLPFIATATAVFSDLYYAFFFGGDYDTHFAMPVWNALSRDIRVELLALAACAIVIGLITLHYNRLSLEHIKGIFSMMTHFAHRYHERHGRSIYDPLLQQEHQS
jgi:hypothetical protein